MTAHILNPDLTGMMDMDYMAEHIRFPDSTRISARALGTRDFDLPDTFYCEAAFSYVEGNDFPYTDLGGGAVMSERIYEILAKIGLPQHRTRPVVMLDDTSPFQDRIDVKTGKPNPDVSMLAGYLFAHLLEHSTVIDYDLSQFDECTVFPGKVGVIRKLVLKEPETGFPPIFRMSEDKSKLFVSDQAQQALVAAGITGCRFQLV